MEFIKETHLAVTSLVSLAAKIKSYSSRFMTILQFEEMLLLGFT